MAGGSESSDLAMLPVAFKNAIDVQNQTWHAHEMLRAKGCPVFTAKLGSASGQLPVLN